jgi:ubiquinone biosynthesis protein
MLSRRLLPSRLPDVTERKTIPVREPRKPSVAHLIRVWLLFAWYFIQVVWLWIRGRLTGADSGRRLRDALERLGGLWIKFGQLLSLRTDVFSYEFCRELGRLQDQATAFPPRVAKEIIEGELGGPLERFFDEFDEAPVAAASIGQVHLARLRGRGAWVAVKVQRPYTDWASDRELALVRLVVRAARRLWFVPDLRWEEMLWELDQIVTEETDYRFEASNMRRMRKSLRPHRVYVPRVFGPYCTRRILVTEFIDGVLMTDYIRLLQDDPMRCAAWCEENNIRPSLVASHLYHSLLRQLLEDNLFHGDPHPGNIILLRDSRVALIDFGTVGSMEREYHQKIELLIRAIAGQDYSKAADVLFLLAGALPPQDLVDAKQELIRGLRAWERRVFTAGIAYKDKSMSNISNELIRIMFRHGCIADWSFLRITRAQDTMDQCLMHLDPYANYIRLTKRYIRRAERRAKRRALRLNQLGQYAMMLAGGLAILGRAAENAMLQGWLIRRQVQVFKGQSSKISHFFAVVLGRGAQLLVLAGILVVLALLRQHHSGWVPGPITQLFGDLLRSLPHLGYMTWLLILVIMFFAYRTSRRLKKDLSRSERPRAGPGG